MLQAPDIALAILFQSFVVTEASDDMETVTTAIFGIAFKRWPVF